MDYVLPKKNNKFTANICNKNRLKAIPLVGICICGITVFIVEFKKELLDGM